MYKIERESQCYTFVSFSIIWVPHVKCSTEAGPKTWSCGGCEKKLEGGGETHCCLNPALITAMSQANISRVQPNSLIAASSCAVAFTTSEKTGPIVAKSSFEIIWPREKTNQNDRKWSEEYSGKTYHRARPRHRHISHFAIGCRSNQSLDNLHVEVHVRTQRSCWYRNKWLSVPSWFLHSLAPHNHT